MRRLSSSYTQKKAPIISKKKWIKTWKIVDDNENKRKTCARFLSSLSVAYFCLMHEEIFSAIDKKLLSSNCNSINRFQERNWTIRFCALPISNLRRLNRLSFLFRKIAQVVSTFSHSLHSLQASRSVDNCITAMFICLHIKIKFIKKIPKFRSALLLFAFRTRLCTKRWHTKHRTA